jgi:DNA-binding LacI/PurR family transcriptional regulator
MSARRPTLEEVATRAGVSRATVSRVVNGLGTVDPAMRDTVLRAIAETGYVPNRSARTLVTQRTDMIALVASESQDRVFGDPFFSSIVRGVSAELGKAEVQLVLMLAQGRADVARIARYLVPGHVDGALMISQHGEDPLPAAAQQARLPLVIGGRPPESSSRIPYVDHDNVGGAEHAVRHLQARGRKRIATIAGPKDMTAGIDRLAGYRRALGSRFRAGRVAYGDFTYESGVAAAMLLLERVPELDAVFAASDMMALGCLAALRQAGRRVPDDVAVASFDDIPAAAEADPPLTTIRQSVVTQGRVMARMLLARTHPDRPTGQRDLEDDLAHIPLQDDHIVLPVELIVRSTT